MKKVLAILLLAIASVRGDPVGNTLSPPVMSGTGSPEGVVTGTPGTIYRNISGGAAITFYVKESGTGNTGWIAYGSPSGSGAPTTPTYILKTASGSLPNAQALSTLSTGVVSVTNGTGTLSSAAIESYESALEAVMDLQDMQGAVTDAQVPDNITLTYSVYKTGFEGVLNLANLQGSVTDAQVPNNITIDLAATATALATPRLIGGVSFNGTADITPSTTQVVDTAASVTYPLVVESATGNLQHKTDPGLTYDAVGGVLSTQVSFADHGNRFSSTTLEGAIEELANVDGSGPNSVTGKVDWSQIKNMPAGFADGTDDGGGVGGSDSDALHKSISGEIAALTAKVTPVVGDLLVIEDSAASNSKKKATITSLKTPLEGVLNLANLQGTLTDAQIPDSITVNVANSGDTATAFFTSGQIERARGGTGADTSAYGNGLLGSNASNVTIDVDTMGELETALGGANVIDATELDSIAKVNALVLDGDFVATSRQITINGTANEISTSTTNQDLSSDRTWTISLPAAIDLGGKTSFEVPNSAAPTVNTFGQIAADNNLWAVNRGALVFYDGTAPVALVGVLVSDTPTDGQIPRYNSASGTTTWETFTTAPGGSDTQLQYNNAGALAGTAGLTWNSATSTLSATTMAITNLNALALRIMDNVDASHAMVLVNNQDLTADINLNVSTGGATRNLSIPGNATISGTNTGDQTITLTGAVTGTGTGSFATTLAASQSVTSWTLTTPTISGAITFPAGTRQTFAPNTTTPGINVGSFAGDPSTPTNGDLWYNSTANALNARINGATVALGAGGGGGAPTTATYLTTTADATLSAEVVVGTTPGGELGGTWASPTIDDGVTVDAWTMGVSFGTTPAANDNTTKLATTAYVQTELTAYASDTVTFTNKTLDASATGNVLKFKSYPQFTSPLRVDGTNCTIGTTSTTLGYGLATFSGGSVAGSVNWAEFRILVPNDLDNTVEPRVRISDLLGGADTNTRRYVVTLTDVASSASATPSPSATVTNVDIVDASGASGDADISSYVSCTGGTAAALTPGHLLVIRVARDSSSGTDTSTVNSTLLSLELEYAASQ